MSTHKIRGEILIPSAVFYVIAVLLMSSAAFIGGKSFLTAAKNNRALAETGKLAECISQYKLETGAYPTALSKLTESVGQYGPWIVKLPTDVYKKGDNYQYSYDTKSFIVFSVGADGASSSSLATGIQSDDLGFTGI